jgi:uncharacterized protein YlxW (UPF0749 family)
VTEPILVAGVTGMFAVLVAIVQKLRFENKTDHNIVVDKLNDLAENHKEIGADVRDVKADVRGLKANYRDLETRMDQVQERNLLGATDE